MNTKVGLSTLDMTIVAIWIIGMMLIGIIVSYKSKKDTAQDYFLASKSIPWWVVGGSLIASNISAEQFIGMSGSGYAVGFAIAAYELMAAITLIVVAKFLLPIYIDKGIYTMPQFLEQRFNKSVKTGLAIFWVALYLFVNISSVLYLGALALENIVGISLVWAIIGLGIYAATFSITGGLKAVVWTDVIQVTALLFGGFVATYMVLQAVGGGVFEGLQTLIEKAPQKFDMILDKSNSEYMNLPGISVLVGGMWIANLYYWGNNQYIIQRALASKSIDEAQKGAAFAAIIKVILPIIIVIPGIAAFVLGADFIVDGKPKSDLAYPWVVNNYVGVGFKGISLAALIAAIGSSVAAMVNSASTIFTLDIYRPLLMKSDPQREHALDAHQHDSQELNVKEELHLVKVGKISAFVALVTGMLIAPSLGTLDQAFQFIQEFTGFISPGVVAIFLMGMFWKKTSARAAMVAVIMAIPLSAAFKYFAPMIPFMDRMGLCFLIIVGTMVVISMMENKNNDKKAIYFNANLFKTTRTFNIMAICVILAVAAIYIVFW
ncbi:MAG: sodium/solute symporter [Lewinellaceae bacterium]|nr:sodium/solute symporter [Lewinellaceae bacterium]